MPLIIGLALRMKFVDDILIFIEHENLAFIGKEGIGIDLAGFFIHEDHVAERAPLAGPILTTAS